VASGATYVDPVMTPVFTAPLVTDISISGIAASAMCFSNITLTLANNDRALECIGSLGAREMALGRAEVTIAFSLYYADSELLEMLMVQTEFAMAFTLTDSDTPANSYIFEIPRAKLTQCNVVAGGTGQDVMADCVASGLLDTVTGTSLRITRTPGPALADDIDEGEGTLESANLAKESEPGHPEPVPAELLTEAR
ncbi:MAG TPA: phage tail tube protein, partial [Mycobacterium sp.]|nr:phage tail tube protein [Mycobacterium sp.]